MDTKTIAIILLEALAFVSLLYGVGVFLTRFKRDITQRNFGLFCFAVAGWLASQGLLLYITDPNDARIYLIIVYTFANITALMFSAFIASLTRTHKKYVVTVRYSFIGFLIGQAILIFVNPVSGVTTDPATGITSPTYNYAILPLFALYPVSAFVMSIVTILRSKTVTKSAKNRLVQIAVIYLISVLIAAYLVPNSAALPVLRLLVINLLTLTLMLVLGKQVVVDRFIDLRRSGWRLLLKWVAVWASLFVAIGIAAFAYIKIPRAPFLSAYWSEYFAMFLAVGLSLAAIYIVSTLVKKWLKKFETDIHGFNKSMQELQFDLGYTNLSEQFASSISLFFKPADILVVLETQKTSKLYAFSASYNKSVADFKILEEDIPQVNKVVDMLPSFAHGTSGMTIKKSHGLPGYSHLFDIHAQHVRGAVILSEKYDGVPFTPEELVVLAGAVHQYSLLLENTAQFETIQQFNERLKEEVDEATHELSKTYSKLKELDATKDEFISMASHQLRTPLTSVKGYVSMVLDGDAGEINKSQRDLLSQAFISSQRMVYLIADLLNVSRLKSGKFVIELRPTYLPDTIDTEINQVAEVAKGRGLTLDFKKPKTFPTLMLDEVKTRQVIMNFVDNAIYYTPKGGHVTVELEDTTDTIHMRVIDNGIGVSKTEQKHLFTKFYRGGNARKARPDGTGLGLFMAKKVVIAQGGQIVFESKAGKGSTFGFKFPKSSLEVPANKK